MILAFLGGRESTLGAPSYSLTEKLTLPEDFATDFGAQLVAVAAAQVAPATEQAGTYLVDLLQPVAARLERLVDNPPAGLRAERITDLLFSLALASATLGEQSGQREPFERAVAAYREALKEMTRERVPLDWAMTQNNLGNALQTLGERESGTARLDEAVAAYREALKEMTRERVPLQWATTQNNLGTALRTLGERESGTARLDEAVAAYREALKEMTRERVPLQWAYSNHGLAHALEALALRSNDREMMAQATASMQAAMAVYRTAGVSDWREVAERSIARMDAELAEMKQK